MNKHWAVAAGLLALAAAIVLLFTSFSSRTLKGVHQEQSVASVLGESSIPSVTVEIGFPDGPDRVSSAVSATTPYQALVTALKEANLPIRTKQYDFGILVTAIGGTAADAAHGWVYEVNGSSGTVAADKYELKQGDRLYWHFVRIAN